MFNFYETKDIRTVFFIFSNTMTVKKEITKKKKPKQKQKQKQKQTVVVNVHVGDKAGKGKEKENRMISSAPIYVSSDNRMQAPNFKPQIPLKIHKEGIR